MVIKVVGIKVHEAANIMPMIDLEHWPAFVESVVEGARSGSLDRIEILDGELLDGRHRWAALYSQGINPRDYCVDVHVDDPVKYVIRKNMSGRRQLTKSQMAMIAASMVTTTYGSNQHSKTQQITVAKAAEIVGVSEAQVDRCRMVLKSGDEEAIGKVRRGEASVISVLKARNKPESADERTLRMVEKAYESCELVRKHFMRISEPK